MISILRDAIFASLFAMTVLAGCGRSESYSAVSLGDPRLAEFGDLLAVDRASLGLVALPASADVRVERSTIGSPYQAMLHVYAKHQQRTIAFRQVAGKLKWIGEQIIVYGPRTYTTADGVMNEEICLDYATVRISNPRLNQLNVSYSGPDAVLGNNRDLTLADVEPLLDQWLKRP